MQQKQENTNKTHNKKKHEKTNIIRTRRNIRYINTIQHEEKESKHNNTYNGTTQQKNHKKKTHKKKEEQ